MKSLKFIISLFVIVMILIFIPACSGTEPTVVEQAKDEPAVKETTVAEKQQEETTELVEEETIEKIKIEGKIIFSSDRDGDNEIYIMNADGSEPVNLTNNNVDDYILLTTPISNDGKKIAFQSDIEKSSDVYVMNLDGSDVINSMENTDVYWDNFAYPVDKKIVGYEDYDGNWDIYIGNADGSEKKRLTDDPASDTAPCLSPDGQKIVFESDREGNLEGICDIYIMNVDGSDQKRLTNNPDLGNFEPYFSPDGQKIAFVSWRDGNAEIYIMNTDGSNQIRITNNPAIESSPIFLS